jgi:uncharacterized phage protein (TIGR02218 family)
VKTIPSPLQTHYNTRATTTATALKVVRPDGNIYAFTSHDSNNTVLGQVYSSSPGLDASSVIISAGAAVGNLELTTLHDGTVFTMIDILSGRWRNSSFILFRYNWASPTDGIETLLTGTFGDVQLKRASVVVELRDLRQYLQQTIGDSSSKTCRARLGDSRCTVALGPWTKTGIITNVTSQRVFRDSARTEVIDFFGEGEITFNSGANIGVTAKVAQYAVDGTFTLALNLFAPVSIGDTYTAVAGCRKRLTEDCKLKFNNVLNMQAEPHRAGLNSITKAPNSLSV